jgi:hypothetical protein
MLRVPIIYIERRLKSGEGVVDVLAVDAAGSGDVHVVEVKVPNNFVTTTANLREYITRLREIPSHFKWLVLPRSEGAEKLAAHPSLFASNGLGRVGIILITEGRVVDDLPTAEVLVRAERFRVPPAELVPVERFIEKHQPDIAVRI